MEIKILDLHLKGALRNLRDSTNSNKGVVAACLISLPTRWVYATSERTDEGKYVHAERNALSKYLREYGDPLPNSVMITSISPCKYESKSRAGCSCIDLLLGKDKDFKDYGIRRLHAGILDNNSRNLVSYSDLGFDISVSEKPSIELACSNLREYFNPEIRGKVNIQEFIENALKGNGQIKAI
jgi:pyrimidine deaminase RibD-like protein